MYCGPRMLNWFAPAGTGPPSGSEVVAAGMFQTTQCVMSLARLPAGTATSTSCMISAKLAVAAGAPVQLSCGDTPVAPAYFAGISPPSGNDVEVTAKVMSPPRP